MAAPGLPRPAPNTGHLEAGDRVPDRFPPRDSTGRPTVLTMKLSMKTSKPMPEDRQMLAA
jgi:hypothetical protein